MKRILLLVFLFVPSICHSSTLADIKTQIRNTVRDNPSDTARRRYSDTVLLQIINEGQREVNNISWACDTSQTYTLSPLTTYYDLPSDLIAVNQVYFKDKSGNLIELEEYLQKSLYDTFPNWDRSNGSPVYYWISSSSGTSVTSTNRPQISYIPIPTRQSTGTVTVWYYNQPVDLASDTDVPFDGQSHLLPYGVTLVYYTIARIKMIESKNDEAVTYQTLYQNAVAIMKSRIGQAPNYTPGVKAGGK